jgi:hypothetical protein
MKSDNAIVIRTSETSDYPAIHVTVSHYKNRGEAHVDIRKWDADESGITFTSLMDFQTLVWEKMVRKSPSRLTTIEKNVREQVETRSGRVWDAVLSFAKQYKLPIADRRKEVA